MSGGSDCGSAEVDSVEAMMRTTPVNRDFMQRRLTERRVNASVKKSTVSMTLANHEAPLDVGVDAAFSETALHKVLNDVEQRLLSP